MRAYLSSFRIAGLCVGLLASLAGSYAQDAGSGVAVRFQVMGNVSSAVGDYPEGASLSTTMSVPVTDDQPSGNLSLSGQSNVQTSLYAVPPGVTSGDLKLQKYVGHLLPGKHYSMTITGYLISDVEITATLPAGYQMEIDGVARTFHQVVSNALFSWTKSVTFRVLSPLEAFGGRAGTATSIASGRISWQVALGASRSGESAGALALIDAGTAASWSSLFTPAALQYEATSSEISVYRDNGNIRQILANEACVDVVTLSSTSYELRFYHFDQMQGSSGLRTFNGFPFVAYRIEQDGSGTKLKITSETRQVDNTFSGTAPSSATVIGVSNANAPIQRTAATTLERTGTAPAFTWNLQDWNTVGQTQQVQETRTWGGTTSARTEAISVGSGVSQGSRTFNKLNWGDEIVSTTAGSNSSTAVTTALDYYGTVSAVGSYGAVRSRSTTGGVWEAYEYDSTHFGVVTRVHRPYQGSPSAVPGNLPANTSGEITSFTYTDDAFGRPARPTLIQTTVNGTTTAKAEISYSKAAFAGLDTLYVVTATRKDYSASGSYVTSVSKYFQEDAGLYSSPLTGAAIRPHEDFFRSKPYSLTRPDGTKQVFAHQLGTWNGSAFTKSGNNGLDSATDSRTVTITGSATGSTSYTAYDGFDIDDLYLIAGKSVLQAVIRDRYVRVVRTENYVWSGSDWVLLTYVNYDQYDRSNQLTHAVASNGAVREAEFSGELKLWEKDPTGIKLSYTYDPAGRVQAVTKEGTGSIGALTTRFTYDAEDRVTQQVVGYGLSETMTSSRAYDDAGRLISESRPGPNGSALTTSFAYDPANRQRTVTLPNGGTRIEAFHTDGSLQQVTGTGVVPEYFTYTVESDGSRYARVNLGGSSSSRLQESWADWLGRTKKNSRPGFTGQNAFVEETTFNGTTGQPAKTTRTGLAETLYAYGDLGRLVRTGSDLNANDSLDNASNDRIAESDAYFEQAESAWWFTEESKTYPTAGNGTALLVARTRQRLTGFGTNVQAETVSLDVDGNTTRRTVTVERGTKTVTISTTTTGIINSSTLVPQVETIVNGLTTSITRFDGLTYNTGYDALHRPVTASDPRTGNRTTAYKTGSTFVSYVQDAATPANTVVAYTYDNAGRVVATTDAAGKIGRVAYNALDQVVYQWGDTAYPVEYGYDSLGQRTTLKTYRGGSGWTGSSWPTGSTGTADTTTWAYDAPSGLVTSKTDAKSKAVSFTYNVRGQTATRTWARGTVTTYGYDSLTGELLTQTYSDGTPTVTYAYTRTGQVDSVADLTGTRDLVYDSGQPLRIAAVGLPAYYGSRVLTRQYDAIKRPIGFLLGTTGSPSADLTQTHAYQAATGRFDQLVTTSAAQAARTFSYGYNTGGLVSGLSVVSSPFTVAREYEAKRDLLTAIDAKWSGTSRTRYDYTYNALAQRSTAKQSGDVFGDFGGSTYYRYAYNDRGELKEAVNYFGETPSSTSAPQMLGRRYSFAYDSLGNRTWSDRAGVDSNPADGLPDLRETYSTNEVNQYTQKSNDVTYATGTARAASTVTVTGAASPSGVLRAGAYWGAALTPNNAGGPASVNLTVNATWPGGGSGGVDLLRTESRTAAIAAALQTFSYDFDGNLTSDGVWNYTYDGENRLVQMTTTTVAVSAGLPNRTLEYKYDYLGRRVQKRSVDATASTETYRRYLYDGWDLVAEFNAPGGTSCGDLLRSYTWGLDLAGSLTATGGVGALVQLTDHASSTSYFPTYDGNGNVASLLRAADGVVAAKYEYSPFGELVRCEGAYAKSNPFRFSTKFTDDESGLVYYGARYYSPSLGRFINRDPIAEAGGINLYGFCGNDGINGVDYLGYFSLKKLFKKIWKPLVAIVVGVVTGGMAYALAPALGITTQLGAAILAGGIGGFASGATGAALNGAGLGGILKSGVIGGAIGAALGGIGYNLSKVASPPNQFASSSVTANLSTNMSRVMAAQAANSTRSLISSAAGAAFGGGAAYLQGLADGAWGAVKGTAHAIAHPIAAVQGLADGLGTFAGRAFYDTAALGSDIRNGLYETVVDPSRLGNAVGSVVGGAAIGGSVNSVAGLASRALTVESGVSVTANFAQATFRQAFSKAGAAELSRIAGTSIRTIDDLVAAIESGAVRASDIPINYIQRGGNTLLLNTRTAQALEQAGVPRNLWNGVNRSGDEFFEQLLTDQLKRNQLGPAGTPMAFPE